MFVNERSICVETFFRRYAYSPVEFFSGPPNMNPVRIAARVASRRYSVDESQSEIRFDKPEELSIALSHAQDAGYKVIEGLLDIAGSIYVAIAISKNPSVWEVYKGHRDLQKSDSFVLCWWFDSELSAENESGELIYEEYVNEETGEKSIPNREKYSVIDPDYASEIIPEASLDEVIARTRGILDGSITDRWNAPRTD